MDISIYVDESSQDCHRYMVLSALILESSAVPACTAKVLDLRQNNGLHPTKGEIKWSKVSRGKIGAYEAICDEFFSLNQNDDAHWHCIIVDNAKLNHRKFNDGDSDIGFSKFIYQLLVSIGRKYEGQDPGNMRFYVTLDYRTSKQPIGELRDIVNNGLRKHWKIRYAPFKRIVYADSKQTPMLQVNEIILGATAFHKNGRHVDGDPGHPKVRLAARIAAIAGFKVLGVSTAQRNIRFSVWNFSPQK